MAGAIDDLSGNILLNTRGAVTELNNMRTATQGAAEASDTYVNSGGKLVSTIRTMRQEHRMQNFAIRETMGAFMGTTMAIGAFSGAMEGGTESTRKLTQTLMQAVLTFQGLNFALTALGAASGWGLIVGAVGAVLLLFSHLIPTSKEVKETFEDQEKALNKLVETYDKWYDRLKGDNEEAKKSVSKAEYELIQVRIDALQQYIDTVESHKDSLELFYTDPKKATEAEAEVSKARKRTLDENKTALKDLETLAAGVAMATQTTITKATKPLTEEQQRERLGQQMADYGEYQDFIERQQRETYQEGQKELRAETDERTRRYLEAHNLYMKWLTDEAAKRHADEQAQQQLTLSNISVIAVNLRAAFSKSGDDFLAKLTEAVQIAVAISKALEASKGGGLGGILGIIGSAIPGLGLLGSFFDEGGVVQGERGAARLVVAHAGEMVLPTHRFGLLEALAQAASRPAAGPAFDSGGVVSRGFPLQPVIVLQGTLEGQTFLQKNWVPFTRYNQRKLPGG